MFHVPSDQGAKSAVHSMVLSIIERMLMAGFTPDEINAIYYKGVKDGKNE